jgi:hypothetical protein
MVSSAAGIEDRALAREVVQTTHDFIHGLNWRQMCTQ